MPSRNKRNRNRAQTQATSGANLSKNETTAVKISEEFDGESAAIKEQEPTIAAEPKQEPPQNVQPKVIENEGISDQMQACVDLEVVTVTEKDVKRVNLVAAISNAESDVAKNVENQPQVETQTAKKKRNRNRNRKKNPANTDESCTSSTSGTHENSPTSYAQTVLATTDVITSAIKEEPNRVEIKNNEKLEESNIDIDVSKNDENDGKASDEIRVDGPKDEPDTKIEEKSEKCDEHVAIIDQIPAKIDESSTEIAVEKMSSGDGVTKELEIEPTEVQAPTENKQHVRETEQFSKEKEKQLRQTKNKNKNKKEQNVTVQAKKNNQNKDQTHQRNKSEEKSVVADANKMDLDTEHANSKCAGEVEKLHEISETDCSKQPNVIDTDVKQQQPAENRIDRDETKTDQSNDEDVKIAEPNEQIVEAQPKIDAANPTPLVVEEAISDVNRSIISPGIDTAQTENKPIEKEIEKMLKANEKQKKSRQTKNGNKNQAKPFDLNVTVDTVPTKIDQNKEIPNDHSADENDATNTATEMHTVDLLDFTVSPSAFYTEDRKNQIDSIEKPISAEAIESSHIAADENQSVERADETNHLNVATTDETSQIDVSINEQEELVQTAQIEETVETARIEIETVQVSEIQCEINPKPIEKSEIELRTETKQDGTELADVKQKEPEEQPILEIKAVAQPVLETRTSVTPNGTPKQSKKSKSKKSRTENAKEQPKADGSKDISPADIVAESKSPSPKMKEKNEIVALPEDHLEKASETESKELQIEPPIQIKDQEIEVEKLTEKSAETNETSVSAEDDQQKIPDIETEPNKSSESTSTIASSDVQFKEDVELKNTESSVAPLKDELKTPTTTPILTTPAAEPKKSVETEDETAKIWKILEEASKSLEPVEIQMDVEDAMPILDKTPIEVASPIVACTSKDEQQVKEEAENLVTLLETKESIKPKPSVVSKAAHPKENNQKPKQSSPSKTIAVPPQRSTEPKKKDAKSAPKNAKPTKPNQSKQKTPEKTVKTNVTDKVAPSDEQPETITTNDDEMPLDVSILPNETELSELNADSKNVQGSDFVPSVEQSTVETKSLPFDNMSVKPTDFVEQQIDDPADEMKIAQPNSTNSTNEKFEENANENATDTANSKPNAKSQVSEKLASNDTPSLVVIEENNNQVGSNIASESKTQPKSKAAKSDPSSTAVNQAKNGRISMQKEANSKKSPPKSPPKSTQNNKKPNGKPAIPPKPDNLISTQTKNLQIDTPKLNKSPNILVLRASKFDDEEESEEDCIEYKFMPRQVFIATICQLCKKPTKSADRILCQLCQMVSYCSHEHVANDESLHKDLCAALQEIAKKRGKFFEFLFFYKNKMYIYIMFT